MTDKTCGNCRHWAKVQNTNNLSAQNGECRFGPPTVVGQTPNGLIMRYAQVPSQFPACHQHEPEPITT